MSDAKTIAKNQWIRLLRHGIEIDEWGGQMEEASAEYKRCMRAMESQAELSPSERSDIERLKECLHQRVVNMEDINGRAGLSLRELKLVVPVMDSLFTGRSAPFPVDLSKFGFTVRERYKVNFDIHYMILHQVTGGEVQKLSEEKIVRLESIGRVNNSRIPSG